MKYFISSRWRHCSLLQEWTLTLNWIQCMKITKSWDARYLSWYFKKPRIWNCIIFAIFLQTSKFALIPYIFLRKSLNCSKNLAAVQYVDLKFVNYLVGLVSRVGSGSETTRKLGPKYGFALNHSGSTTQPETLLESVKEVTFSWRNKSTNAFVKKCAFIFILCTTIGRFYDIKITFSPTLNLLEINEFCIKGKIYSATGPFFQDWRLDFEALGLNIDADWTKRERYYFKAFHFMFV